MENKDKINKDETKNKDAMLELLEKSGLDIELIKIVLDKGLDEILKENRLLVAEAEKFKDIIKSITKS